MIKSRSAVKVTIRSALQQDLENIVSIEKISFIDPWIAQDFINFKNQRDCIIEVAEYHRKVIGFICYKFWENHFEIINIAVSAEFLRKTVGSQMVAKVRGRLSRNHKKFISLIIRETNVFAQLFFFKCGFKAVRVIREYFEDTGEDAYLMEQCIFGSNRFKSIGDISHSD